MQIRRLPSDSRGSSQQPAPLPQNRLSSRAMTASIELSNTKQQDSFAAAEGVVQTQVYASRSILWTTTLSGLPQTSFIL